MKFSKTVLALSALFAVSAVSTADNQVSFDVNTAPVNDRDIVDYVNSNNFGWKATTYPQFEGMTIADANRKLHNTYQDPVDVTEFPLVQYHAKDIPDHFDASEEWKDCIHPIRDQAQCGSCWAFGAAETLSDRFCIHSNGEVNEVLSTEDLVACDNIDMGCNGGWLSTAWRYMEKSGIPTEECYPYTSGSGYTARCSHGTCQNGDEWKVYKAKAGSTKSFPDEASMQTEIMTNGPIEGSFTVYQDFYMYSSGVYEHKTGGVAGGHAIKVNGWGVDENGTPYWIVSNSWGTSWGMKGFFWIKRGNNECGIERGAYAGLPDL